MVGRAEPWLWAAGLICRAEGIEPGGKLEVLDGEARTPNVLVPPASVVKFHAHWADGHRLADREADSLRRLAASAALSDAAPPLIVPRLLHAGSLEDYRYNVMDRVPGTPLRQLEALEGPVDREAIPSAIGAFVRWLHEVPLAASEIEGAWPSFLDSVAELRSGARELNRVRGLPDHLLAELEAWLPTRDELAGEPSSAVFCHGALDPSNVLGWLDGVRFVPTAVIDFARACIGSPLAELGSIWWDLVGADSRAFAETLSTAGVAVGADPHRQRRALAWILLRADGSGVDLSGLHDVADLTSLASRWLGPGGAPVPATTPVVSAAQG
jgi:hygromycin-B 7''-O-kinase